MRPIENPKGSKVTRASSNFEKWRRAGWWSWFGEENVVSEPSDSCQVHLALAIFSCARGGSRFHVGLKRAQLWRQILRAASAALLGAFSIGAA
jgi:hypothetical protein